MSNDTAVASKRVISVVEAGRILGLGKNGAYAAVRSGQIPVLKFGKQVKVPMDAINRMLETTEQPNQKQSHTEDTQAA